MLGTFGWTELLIMLLFYPLPAYIAVWRKHPQTLLILLVTLLLGWTLVAWIVSLIWSLRTPQSKA
ncbi:MAG: superinfection immunity protein [Chloroflexi bacterium]|nr:superinfection immunity protein [Chloroflexota bacterium]